MKCVWSYFEVELEVILKFSLKLYWSWAWSYFEVKLKFFKKEGVNILLEEIDNVDGFEMDLIGVLSLITSVIGLCFSYDAYIESKKKNDR